MPQNQPKLRFRMNKEEGREIAKKLVSDFEKSESYYISKEFQEAEVRTRFIDPFFTALGWDFHQTDIAKVEWDVHREFSQRDNSSTKKPDYAFRAKDGNKFRVKFFVEAKAPWIKLTDCDPVYQAKRYAFSSHGKTPIVILTDFQEFRVFNGFERPVYENPLQGLIGEFDFKYTDYVSKWDKIWESFSKEAVANGSIAILTGAISKSTKTLDDEFLADISSWRETLAKSIALRNRRLKVDELNEAVQRIIDRLVFIRNLEDRGIEPENSLFSYADTKQDTYKHLLPLFRKLDADYNGLLFKKHFSEDLVIDDKIIKAQIKNLCYPLSPYQFDEIEPEILGRIYEKFLGSKIRLTDNHSVKIEEKLEVRKAGGVYYTPQYVVNYIIRNTIGKIIEGKSPDEIALIRILDPACGSGSFLLGAFEFLMEYHKMWYKKASQTAQKKHKSDFYYTSDKEIKLTLKKRSEILRNNIFGVDLDREATEVTIMSLYLKLLDDGFDKGQVELFMRGSILPDMTGNIKCGNSLIDSNFFRPLQLSIEDRIMVQSNIKPFSYSAEFSGIIRDGFDAVIGNPPYGADILIEQQPYLQSEFSTYEYQLNSFTFFIEKGQKLLKPSGIISYIVPAVLHNQHYFSKVRSFMLSNTIVNILHLLKYRVFDQAEIGDTLIFTAEKGEPGSNHIVSFRSTHNIDIDSHSNIDVSQRDFAKNPRCEFLPGISNPILRKAYQNSVMLNTVASCVMGIKPYQTNKGKPKQTKDIVVNRPFDSNQRIDESYKQYIIGKDIHRYRILPVTERFIKYGVWLAEPRPHAPFEREKIVCRQTADHIIAAIDNSCLYNLNNVYNIEVKESISSFYLLGLLNSRLFRYFYYEIVGERGRTFAEVKKVNLEKLPICISNIDLIRRVEKIAREIVELSSLLVSLKSETDMSSYNKTIYGLDDEIDQIVYCIYDISPDEIAEIEADLHAKI